MKAESCAIGVDLGGTKVAVAIVDGNGRKQQELRAPTDTKGGPDAVTRQVVDAVKELLSKNQNYSPVGVGVGVAGQIAAEKGVVRFAPNLNWREVPFQDKLREALEMKVVVTNDVRAITWGEWLFGAGKGCDDLICMFVGTGIGGGIVSGGRILNGCGNTAGEIGHITVEIHGPECTCGNRGCMEALAGGWGIAREAKQAAAADPDGSRKLLAIAGGEVEDITAATVAEAYHAGDALAAKLVEDATEALIAGTVSLINAFNPCRLIVGGGVIDGLPGLVQRLEQGVRKKALAAATEVLQVITAQLGDDAGVVGSAALAMQSFADR